MNKAKVLFVDDDLNPSKDVSEEIRNILTGFRSVIEECGEVVEAYSYDSALQKIEDNSFDLGIIDVVLPESNSDIEKNGKSEYGKVLIKELTKRNIPVIAISNKTDLSTVSELHGNPFNVKKVIDKRPQEEYKKKLKKWVELALKPKERERKCAHDDPKNTKCIKPFTFAGEESIFLISSNEKRDFVSLVYKQFRDHYNMKPWIYNRTDDRIFCQVCEDLYGYAIIMAEISDLNPNVFYEIGFAYGLGREVKLLQRKGEANGIEWGLITELFRNTYSEVDDIERILKEINPRYYIYNVPKVFRNVYNFRSPENRDKDGYFVVSFNDNKLKSTERYLKSNSISSLQTMNLSSLHNVVEVVQKLINAIAIAFIPEKFDTRITLNLNRTQNARLLLISGICVAQGIPVRFFTNRNLPLDIKSLKVEEKKDLVDFLKSCPLK